MSVLNYFSILLTITFVLVTHSRHTHRRHRSKAKDRDPILSKKNSINSFPGKAEEEHELNDQLEELNSIDADEHLRDLSKIEMESQEEKLGENIAVEGERMEKLNKLEEKEKEKGNDENHLLSLSKAIENVKI
ncbi:hypothetical protein SNEBB_000214 [Seison nebaliae]|nr:hypothetical protein SNEBB_000214 [Seison nebaliae]